MMTVQGPTNATIAIAATFTAEPLLPSLRFVLNEAGLGADVRFAPYNQVFQELLAPTTLLKKAADGINIILVRVEDFVREAKSAEDGHAIIMRVVPELCKALSQYVQRVQVPTLFAALPPSPRVTKALLPDVEAANVALIGHVRNLPSLIYLSHADIDLVSTVERYDAVGDELAHMPFTEEHYTAIALAIARKVHALRVPTHKVLVLDCDETLWRGVVGEDGVDGITVTPGLAQLQRFAVENQSRGILICLASKNSERDVLDVFEKRTDMILKLGHVVAHRINWESKPRNVAALARTLNLGLDSFVFIDDNPVECEFMRAELPQVVTLQLPPDGEIDSFLSHLWTFDKFAVTDEDTRRTAMYRENAARTEFEESATDIAAFIASLEVVTDISSPEEGEWPRLAQLTQRTNQFNFTTVRRTETEMRSLLGAGYQVFRVKVRDRFGDYGIVGLVIAKPGEHALVADTFLLSCRVLGRGVEHTILRKLGEVAKQKGLDYIEVPFVATAKNEPAHAFIDDVAALFRESPGQNCVYRIPVEAALAIAHRPGHDPAAVIEAQKAEERKGADSSNPIAIVNSSERYEKLARTLVSDVRVLRSMRTNTVRPRDPANAATPPGTDLERALLMLWQELLGITGLGVDDDYFTLGGTSLIAARMFAEIARRFNARLPLTSILEYPTVRALAQRLTRHRAPDADCLVALKSGGPRNLFLVHDGDGETLLYLNLARRMPGVVAVIGIEPLRFDKIPLAHGTIEEMAAFYLERVRKTQPHGPYLLGGMCAGGVIAYEMAVRLEREGETVSLVALLDAAAPGAVKRRGRVTAARLERLKQALTQARDTGRNPLERAGSLFSATSKKMMNALVWEITQRSKRLSVRARFLLLKKLLARRTTWPAFVPELSVREIYDSAEARYMPARLSNAPAVLIRASFGDNGDTPYKWIYADEFLGWGGLADNLTAIDVDGGHSSMLHDNFVDSLAGALRSYVEMDETLSAYPQEMETSYV